MGKEELKNLDITHEAGKAFGGGSCFAKTCVVKFDMKINPMKRVRLWWRQLFCKDMCCKV